jgi:Tol biopolymer transport system component
LAAGLGLGETSISPDGSNVAYWQTVNDKLLTFVLPVAKGMPVKVCEFCYARGLSSNGSVLLTQQGFQGGKRARIVAVEIPSGKQKDFLTDPTSGLWHPFFSWDDQWVCFKRVREEPRAALMIARVRNGVPPPPAEWISVTDGRFADDKPQFSPDGNTLYFTSTRDNYLCIWAQRLDRITKHPVGVPFAVQHFHNAQSCRIMDNLHVVQLWIARDKIVTNFPEFHGDIWMSNLN